MSQESIQQNTAASLVTCDTNKSDEEQELLMASLVATSLLMIIATQRAPSSQTKGFSRLFGIAKPQTTVKKAGLFARFTQLF